VGTVFHSPRATFIVGDPRLFGHSADVFRCRSERGPLHNILQIGYPTMEHRARRGQAEIESRDFTSGHSSVWQLWSWPPALQCSCIRQFLQTRHHSTGSSDRILWFLRSRLPPCVVHSGSPGQDSAASTLDCDRPPPCFRSFESCDRRIIGDLAEFQYL
jgi:hypothetical protein